MQQLGVRMMMAGQARLVQALLPSQGSPEQPLTLAALQVGKSSLVRARQAMHDWWLGVEAALELTEAMSSALHCTALQTHLLYSWADHECRGAQTHPLVAWLERYC